MEASSQSTPTPAHLSIQSMLSPRERPHMERQPESSQAIASTSNFPPSPAGQSPSSGFGTSTTAGQSPVTFKDSSSITSPIPEPYPVSPRGRDPSHNRGTFEAPSEQQRQMQQQYHHRHQQYQQPEQYYLQHHQKHQHHQQHQQQQQQQQQHRHHSHQLPSLSSLPPMSTLPPSVPLYSLPQPQSTQTRQDYQQQFHHTLAPTRPHQQTIGGQQDPSISLNAGSSGSVSQKPLVALSTVNGHPQPSLGVLRNPSVLEGKKAPTAKRAPMRSSIACLRCRRSKIKCVNDGEGKSACETCLKSRRDCRYLNPNSQLSTTDIEPQFAITTAPKNPRVMKRDDPGQTERIMERKRLRKMEDSVSLDEQKSGAYYANEVLSEHYFTETMWTQLFDLYRLHFATELPFLHLATLKEKMGDKMRATQTRRSDGTNLILLGVLTLTARFHHDLVKRVTFALAVEAGQKPSTGNPDKADGWATSEHFASVLCRALGPLSACVRMATVERVQAFLMLGLYEWIRPNKRSDQSDRNDGMAAWMYVGFGIRMAECLKLGVRDEPPRQSTDADAKLSASSFTSTAPTAEKTVVIKADTDGESGVECSSSATASTKADATESRTEDTGTATPRKLENKPSAKSVEDIVTREVRRRTIFSCFVMDRMLACGKNRSTMIHSDSIKVQLPCSNTAFDQSCETFPGFLRPRPEIGKEADGSPLTRKIVTDMNDSLLARFVCLVDIWGEISAYSFAGGRHKEKRPPWEETEFRRLRGILEDFYDRLPYTFTFSTSNYLKYENHHASTEYVSLHMLGAVCKIMLHREYTPFIPARCRSPMGPLDEPTFPDGSAPPGFWERSAEEIFTAAREVVDLIEICQTRQQMPVSALVVFAVWTTAFVGIYAWHFPGMDVNYSMVTKQDADRNNRRKPGTRMEGDHRVSTHGPTAIAYQALISMGGNLEMANTYVKYFHEMDDYYENVKKEYWAHVEKHGGDAHRQKSVRQGGSGGGFDEWKVHGPKVTNNGEIFASEDAAEGSGLSTKGDIDDMIKDKGKGKGKSRPQLMPANSRSSPQRRKEPESPPPSGHQEASEVDRETWQQPQQHGSITSAESAIGGVEPMAVIKAMPADETSDGMHGIVYGSETTAQYPCVNIGGTSGGSGSIGGDIMQAVPAQQWDQFAQHAQQQQQQLQLQQQQQQHHEQQQAVQLYVQDPMAQHQVSSSSSSPPEEYLMNDPAADFPLSFFWAEVAGTVPFVNNLEGKRWQEASQAVGIERFSQADWDGPAVLGALGAEFPAANLQSGGG